MILKEDTNRKQTQDTKNKHLGILFIEDSQIDAHLVRKVLNKYMSYPCSVRHVEDMAAAEDVLKEDKGIDLILLDLGLPDTAGGIDTFQRIEDIKEDIPVVILTCEHDHELAINIVGSGAEDFIRKSSVSNDPELLCDAIDFAICRHKHLADLKKQKISELEEKDRVIQWITGSYSVTQ